MLGFDRWATIWLPLPRGAAVPELPYHGSRLLSVELAAPETVGKIAHTTRRLTPLRIEVFSGKGLPEKLAEKLSGKGPPAKS